MNSGIRYEGTFRNNKKQGRGIMFDAQGNVKYDGEWKDDKQMS